MFKLLRKLKRYLARLLQEKLEWSYKESKEK